MAHGLYNSRPIYNLTEEEERAYWQDFVTHLKAMTGKRLKGRLGSLSPIPARPTTLACRLEPRGGLLPADDQGPIRHALPRGRENGRVMCLSLHPHNIGRPNAAKHLDEALRYVLGHAASGPPPPTTSPNITLPTTTTR
jgi:hypothetical protein